MPEAAVTPFWRRGPFEAVPSHLIPHVLVIAIFVLLLVPYSLEAVAAKIGYDRHVVAFLIGPALYSFGDGLVPGLDFFSQYSVGLGHVFSYLLAPTARLTLLNYVGFMVVSMTLFYVGSFYFLRWFYRSWPWALGVTLTIMVLQFHLDATFVDPSSYVLRYPLLPLVCWLLAEFVGRARSRRIGLLLALALGTSLFLNTETAAYLAVTVTLVTLMVGRDKKLASLRVTALGAVSLATFYGLSLAAFGPRVLDVQYVWRALEPLFMFTGGLLSRPIEWNSGWHYVYNIIAPGIALATVGWVVAAAPACHDRDDRARLAGLLTLSLLSLLMTAKYVNQSVVAVWHVNAYGYLAVMAWWALAWINARHRLPGQSGTTWRIPANVAGVAMSALAVVFLLTAGDSRYPARYALEAYLSYPSLLNAGFGARGPACPELACLGHVSKADVELITDRTDRDERVALISPLDWAYLVEAKRAAKFTVVPSPFAITWQQLEDSIADIDLIFLTREASEGFNIEPAPLREALGPMLRKDFDREADGVDLVAWRRRSASTD